MDARRIKMAGITDLYLGELGDGRDGYWVLQILAIAGTTPVLTPKASLDGGTTSVVRKLSPVDGSADVASANTPGIWYIKGGAPLVLGLAGNANVTLDALLYPVVI